MKILKIKNILIKMNHKNQKNHKISLQNLKSLRKLINLFKNNMIRALAAKKEPKNYQRVRMKKTEN